MTNKTEQKPRLCADCNDPVGDAYYEDVPNVGDLCIGCHASRFSVKGGSRLQAKTLQKQARDHVIAAANLLEMTYTDKETDPYYRGCNSGIAMTLRGIAKVIE